MLVFFVLLFIYASVINRIAIVRSNLFLHFTFFRMFLYMCANEQCGWFFLNLVLNSVWCEFWRCVFWVFIVFFIVTCFYYSKFKPVIRFHSIGEKNTYFRWCSVFKSYPLLIHMLVSFCVFFAKSFPCP